MQFAPNIVVPGDYNLYQWHPYVTNASAGVPHVINFNGGSTTIFANQQTNSGNWSLLGRFNFASGTSGTIRITDATIEPSGTVAIVDGLKLAFVPPTSLPGTPTGLSATPISSSQINLAWNDNASNENNYIVARSTISGGPYTDIATLPANATNYNNVGLVAAATYYYVVRATNFLGASAYSTEATATTLTPPGILSQPLSTTNIAGQNATFTVSGSGTLPLSYQWHFNGGDIAGATDSSYTRMNIQTNDAGAYTVTVTNSAGATSSAPAILTVNFSLSVIPGTGGSVSKDPDQSSYVPSSSVLLTAIPDAGFAFVGWSGDATGSVNPITILMDTNKSITASFIAPPVINSIQQLPDGRFQLQATGSPAHYAVESTSDFSNWSELANFTTASPSFDYTDTETNVSSRYYRIRLIP
jgi:uncharacterized repeat protein (TIGR02543 family)